MKNILIRYKYIILWLWMDYKNSRGYGYTLGTLWHEYRLVKFLPWKLLRDRINTHYNDPYNWE